MKKLYFILALICISLSINVHSQDGWFWLNPLPQGNAYIDVEFTTNNTVYVSAAGNTLMKSTDGGNSFVIMTNRECGGTLTFINDLTGFSSSSGGILKTTNGGNNWRYIPAPVDYVYNFSSTPQTILYGLKDNKVYISSDLGESWSLSLTPLTNNTINAVHFPVNNTGFAGGSKLAILNSVRIYKTTNAGISWDTVPVISRYQVRSIFFINQNTGFANTDNKILKTTNSGLNWDSVYTSSYQYSQIVFFDDINGYLKDSQQFMFTTNQGITWTVSNSYYNSFLKNINEGLGIGTNFNSNFLYKTTNRGSNWSSLTTGFSDYLYDVTFINTLTGFTAGHSMIYKTTNAGISWQSYNLNISSLPAVENIMFLDQNTGYAGIDEGRIAKTTNCGINWEVYLTGNYDHLHGMSFPSIDTGYAFTKYGYYLKTTNAGINWGENSHFTGENYQDVQFINNLTGFAGGYSNSLDVGVIRTTTDGGNNWVLIHLDSILVILDICTAQSGIWYAAGYDYPQNGIIYKSTDLGATWNYNKFPQRIYSIHFPSAMTGFASAYNNITYKTTNGGETWYATYCINSGASQGIYFLDNFTGYAVSPNGQIIKTTTGGGVLISVEPQSYVVPHTYNLYQNYPNPFNPTTKIKFDIPKAMNASLKIYDILGREVSIIVNDFLIPGTYAFDFDGSNLSSGVYFYVLIGEGFVDSRKIVLIK
ncbi:MAG: T9SS type A sorting domain-containing protein [Ignavibacteria bacterium]|nr:T9SS type A sorting domain-containing protein [Ignavibacteria bacterium]